MTSIYHQSKEAAAEARLDRLAEDSGSQYYWMIRDFFELKPYLAAIQSPKPTHSSQSGTDPVI